MRFPARIAFPVLVGVVTLSICTLGVQAELKTAKTSIAEHRLHARLAQRAAESKKANRDDQLPNSSSP